MFFSVTYFCNGSVDQHRAHSQLLLLICYCDCVVFAYLIARHLAFILVFINAHILSFSITDSAENLLETKTYCCPGIVSCENHRYYCSWFLPLWKRREGYNVTAHLCLFASFWSASRTWFTFLGVTHGQIIISSATGISTALSTALLELTVLVRVDGVESAGVSSVGTAADSV